MLKETGCSSSQAGKQASMSDRLGLAERKCCDGLLQTHTWKTIFWIKTKKAGIKQLNLVLLTTPVSTRCLAEENSTSVGLLLLDLNDIFCIIRELTPDSAKDRSLLGSSLC